MKKRGTHVGVIISFAIFITFMLFLVIILEPAIRTQQNREIYLDHLKLALDQRFIGELNTLTLNVSIESGQDCISLKDIVDPIEEEGMDITHLIIKNELDEILNYTDKNKDLQVGTGSSYRGFLKVYYSENFNTSYCQTEQECGLIGCSPQNDYTIKVIKIYNETFEPKINEIIQWYMDNYDELKSDLKIPPGLEFEFGIEFENSEGYIVEASQSVPSNKNIYVQETPILYIDQWGNYKPGTLTLKVWESD